MECTAPAPEASDESNVRELACEALSAQFDAIRQLVEPLDGHMGTYSLTRHNVVQEQPLIRGQEIFGTMAELIEHADEDAVFQTWRWDNDGEPARVVLSGIKKLEERRRTAAAGKPPVVVRLLINAIAFSPDDQMTELGRRIEELNLDPELVDVRLAEFVAEQFGANHAKTLVVDSKVAIVTGANASSDNMGPPPIYWDVGFVVRGEIARALHNDFAGAWADGELWTCGSQLEPVPTGDVDHDSSLPECRTRPDVIPMLDVSLPPEARDGLSCLPVMMAGHKDRIVPFPESKYDNPQNQAFIGMFAFAKERIRIQTPNLNDPMAKEAILAAIRSGIEVDVILSKKYEQVTESIPGRGGSNDDTVDWLHSVAYEIPDEKRCQLLQIRWFSNDGKTAEEVNGPPSSHVKYMSIDGHIVMVGSANQDVQSWQNSREINLVIDSATLTHQFDEKVFDVAWDKAIPVDRCLGFE